jgi:hypothetical protein
MNEEVKALFRACYGGFVDMARALLTDPELNVNFANNLDGGERPIEVAIRTKQCEIIRLLRAHPKIDMSCVQDLASQAIETKSLEVVKAVCDDPRVEINFEGSYDNYDEDFEESIPFARCFDSQNDEMANYFVNHPRFDPTTYNNYIIIVAAREGSTQLVKKLLEYDNVDPDEFRRNLGCYDVLDIAVHFEKLKVVKVLLGDSRVDPTVDGHVALRTSIKKKGHNEIAHCLLDHYLENDIDFPELDDDFYCLKDVGLIKKILLFPSVRQNLQWKKCNPVIRRVLFSMVPKY